MAVNFSVKFIINETTQQRVIRLTDTSTGFTFGKSLFSVYYPDGSSRVKTDYTSPDIIVNGGYIDILPVLDINNKVVTGQYRIVCTAVDDADIEQTPLQRIFDFNWIKPSENIINTSDVVIPEVKFKDINSYDTISSFTGVYTRTIAATFPSTSAIPSISVSTAISNELDVIYQANYYEGIYNPTSTIDATYTHTSYSWLTVDYNEVFTKQFNIKKAPSLIDLVTKINTFRQAIEAYEDINDTQFQILNYQYERVVSLYSHLVARYENSLNDGSQGQLDEFLSIVEPYETSYTYQSTPIQPIEILTGGVITLYDGTNTDTLPIGEILTFENNVTGLNFLVSNNKISLNEDTGYSIPTDASQANWDSAYNNQVVSAAVSGTTTKTITLTQQDGGTVTASWSDLNTDAVTSVFGRTGNVVAANGDYTTSQVTEGTNLYYTQGRFDTAFAAKNTGDLTEGTNLYYTDARFDTRLSTKTTTNLAEGINLYYTQARFNTAFSAKSTSDLSEGTNLYFTNARARAAISVSGSLAYNSTTGVISYTTPSETDPIYTASSWYTTTNNSANWDTAYGWGDHSLVGYLTSYTETDPVFVASPAYGIVSLDITNWDTAYGWGDHSTVGYLTSYTETDPVFVASPAYGITSLQITNWDTAYGWGDHSTQGYATQTYVGTQIAALVDSAPTTLDTLNELAAALGDDPNFATTVTNSIATKVPLARTLTINGTTYDLSLDRTWSVGTVTSVAATVPVGLAISGSPITSSGTLAIAYATGYSIPTDASQANWNTAYGWGDHSLVGYLTSFTETDPIFVASPAYGITSINITNWNTAYGWGDHSTQGYLTSYTETDPIYTASSWYTTTNNSSNWDAAYSWGDHALVGYLTSETSHADVVVDGDFTSSGLMKRGATAGTYSIVTDNSANWNTAYGWGDHSTQGYLTSYTETDPIYTASSWYTTTNNASNWDTAYGWGNHASAGYVPSTRTLTINGTAYDLSADRSWTISAGAFTIGDATDVTITTPSSGQLLQYNGTAWVNWSPNYITGNQTITLSGDATGSGTTSIAVTLANSGVTAASYGSSSSIPVITVDAKGRITSATTQAVNIVSTLAGLSDTTITTPSSGQLLQYNGSAWVNWTPNYLTSYTETDPIYTASSWYSTTNNSLNWDTAYGWGNHASAGYLTAHPAVSAATSVNNSGGTVIQDLTFDSFGHVTGQVSYNLDGRYYTETEVGNFFSGTTAITGYNKSNWDTAYGWGNHASVGYLTSLPSHNHDDRYYTETEVDTLLSAKQAAGNYFTDGDSVLNMANNDGLDYDDTNNVMRVKYDGVLYNIWSTKEFSSTNVSNWNTAYGWGNHASAGYLLSTSYTAADVLAKIKTVDGAGSGLDADLLDGQSSAYYQPASTAITTSNIGSQSVNYATSAGNADTVDSVHASSFLRNDTDNVISNTNVEISFYSNDLGESNSGDQATLEVFQDTSGADAFMQFHISGDYAVYFGLAGDWNDLFVGGWSMGANRYRIWHQGNDGSGSGLDADLLDGNQASAFYLASNPSGYTTYSANQAVDTSSSPSFVDLYIDDQIFSTGDTNTYMQFHAADQWRVVTGGVERLEVNNSAVTVTGNMTVTGTITESSSIRYKENIVDLHNSLDKVLNMRGVAYNKKGNSEIELGVIAEEVADIVPEIINFNKDGVPDSVQYTRLTALLIESIKEQQKKIEKLESLINK